VLRAHHPECDGEIDGAHRLVERILREGEVAASHGDAVVGQPLAELKEATLARASRLVPELVIADLGNVNEPSDLLRRHIAIECLKA
jgi:hypothetical protein